MRSQITHTRERIVSSLGLLDSKLDSKIGLLDSKMDVKYQNIERQLDYILIRLSLKERVKGVIYRLMKKIHKLVPIFIRERYRKGYRRVFFDKVTPADKKFFFDQRDSTEKGTFRRRGIDRETRLERNPIQDFLAFKEEIKRGLLWNSKI